LEEMLEEALPGFDEWSEGADDDSVYSDWLQKRVSKAAALLGHAPAAPAVRSVTHRITVDIYDPNGEHDPAQLLDLATEWAASEELTDDPDGDAISVEYEPGVKSAAHELHKQLLHTDSHPNHDTMQALADVVQTMIDRGFVMLFDADECALHGLHPAPVWRAKGWRGTVHLNNGVQPLIQVNHAGAGGDPPPHSNASEQ